MINEYVCLWEIGIGSYGNGVFVIVIIFWLLVNFFNVFKIEVVKMINFMLYGVDFYVWDDLIIIIYLVFVVK